MQERPVARRALDDAIRHRGEEEAQAHRQGGRRHREDHRDLRGVQVVGVAEQPLEVLEPDEPGRQPEGVLEEDGLAERLRGRPDEEDERDERAGARPGGRAGPGAGRRHACARAGHRARGARVPRARPAPDHAATCSPARTGAGVRCPRDTSVSSASFAVFLPAHTASISSSITSRICGRLPRRMPLELLGGRLVVDLSDRGVAPGVLLVEPLLLRELVGGQGDREVPGPLVRGGLHLGEERYEKNFATPLYSAGLWPARTQSEAPPMIEFWGAPATSGQYGCMPMPNSNLPFVSFDEGRVGGRGRHPHAALAVHELRPAVTAPAAVVEELRLLPLAELLDVADVGGTVQPELGVEAAEAVRLRGERQVVPGGEVLELGPPDPLAAEPARIAGRLELLPRLPHLGPRARGLVGIEAGLLEGVLVDVEDGGRAVEGHRQHPAVRGRVVAGDRRQVGGRVELLAGVRHQLVDRLDRPLGRHHRRRPDLEDLDDVRVLLGPEGGDGPGHRLGVAPLVDRDDLVLGLGLVEAVGEVVHPFAEGRRVRVPPLDLGHGLGPAGPGADDEHQGDERAEQGEPAS